MIFLEDGHYDLEDLQNADDNTEGAKEGDDDEDLHRALQESRDTIKLQRERELDAEDGHDPLQASGAMKHCVRYIFHQGWHDLHGAITCV